MGSELDKEKPKKSNVSSELNQISVIKAHIV